MQRSLLNVLFLPYRMDKISMFMHFWHPHKADLLQGSDFCKFWENIFFNILPLHILNSAFIPFRFVWGLRDASIPLKSEISTVSCPLWIVNNSQTGPNVWIIGLGMNDRLHYPCSQSWDASGMAGVRWVATGWTDANIRRLVWDSNSFYNSQHPPAQTMLLFTAKTKSRRKKAKLHGSMKPTYVGPSIKFQHLLIKFDKNDLRVKYFIVFASYFPYCVFHYVMKFLTNNCCLIV